MVGSPQAFTCTVNTVEGVESTLVTINWIGPEGSYENNSRVTIEMNGMENQMGGTDDTYNSTLQFAYIMEGDEGLYTCSVVILDTVNSQTAVIEFLTSKQTLEINNDFS